MLKVDTAFFLKRAIDASRGIGDQSVFPRNGEQLYVLVSTHFLNRTACQLFCKNALVMKGRAGARMRNRIRLKVIKRPAKIIQQQLCKIPADTVTD